MKHGRKGMKKRKISQNCREVAASQKKISYNAFCPATFAVNKNSHNNSNNSNNNPSPNNKEPFAQP